MRALLDTHVFLWFNADDSRLSQRATALIRSRDNEMVFSAVSAWEIAIKYARGRLPEVPQPPESYIPARLSHYGFPTLAVEISHALQVASLPRLHSDPFDRLLIAQSQVERLPILTSDPNIRRYEVEIIW